MATPVLNLETLVDGQNGAEIVVNEALYMLDAMLGGITAEENTPSASTEGRAVLVGASPTGVFAGHAGEIAIYSNGVWSFFDVGPVRPFWSTTQSVDCEFYRDGSPVLSRVISMGAGPAAAATKTVAHGVTPTITKPLKIEFFCNDGTDAYYGASDGGLLFYTVYVDATNVNWYSGTDMTGFTGWARIEFVD